MVEGELPVTGNESDAAVVAPADVPAGRFAEVKALVAYLTELALALLAGARENLVPVDIAVSAFERDRKINGFIVAGAIAFRLFVFMLPLYLLGLVIAGATFSFSPGDPAKLAKSAGMSKYLAGSIGDAASTSHRSLWVLIPVTLYALFSASRSGYKAIAAAHLSAWGLGRGAKRKLLVVAGGFFGFAVLIVGWGVLSSRIRSTPIGPVMFVLGLLVYGLLWLAASWFLPHPDEVEIWYLLPGAALIGLGSQGLYLFDVLYLNHKIQTASAAYGALGIAASVLLWLYLLGRLMVASPVLNATLWERYHPSAPHRVGPPAV